MSRVDEMREERERRARAQGHRGAGSDIVPRDIVPAHEQAPLSTPVTYEPVDQHRVVGRPPRAALAADRSFQIRVTEEELAELRGAAGREPLATWARRRLLELARGGLDPQSEALARRPDQECR